MLFISKMKNTVLQDTLTFETIPTDEVLKRDFNFEKSKLTTQVFQKLNVSAGQSNGFQIKIKQESIMAIGKKSPNKRRQFRKQYKRRTSKTKNNLKSWTEKNHAMDVDKRFRIVILKVFQIWGRLVKTAKNLTVLLRCAVHNK